MSKPILLACVAMLAPGAAIAQYQMVSPMLYEGPRISLQDHATRSRAESPVARERVPASDATVTSLRYRPDLERRRRNFAHFVEKTRAVDPAGAGQLAKLFAAGDIMQRMQDAMTPYGLRIDDVADAYATYWINAWHAARGRNDTPSRPTIAAVKAQAARALSNTAQLRSADDAAKQEFAESLWIQAMLVDSAIEQAKGKPDQLKIVSRATAQGAHTMGLDLSAMALTEDGFVPTS